MKLINGFLIVAAIYPSLTTAGCPLCDQLREYHRTHPENNYEFYEDYLKDQAAKAHNKTEEKTPEKAQE